MGTKNTKQTDMIKRIESICGEFDSRMEEVGISMARLELAKALASCEASQQDASQPTGKKDAGG